MLVNLELGLLLGAQLQLDGFALVVQIDLDLAQAHALVDEDSVASELVGVQSSDLLVNAVDLGGAVDPEDGGESYGERREDLPLAPVGVPRVAQVVDVPADLVEQALHGHEVVGGRWAEGVLLL